jgi:hypothetical protein
MVGVGQGAASISVFLGVTNAENNSVLVVEPVSYSQYILTAFIGDVNDPAIGDFGANNADGLGFTVENTTPSSFTSAQRSDFYQVCPTGTLDPITGSTNASYFLGYFILNSTGTMTFYRAAAALAPPPAPRIVSITRSANLSTIFFTTTNGTYTYTLYYTNSAGLTSSVSNWPTSPTTVIGNGNTNSLTDTTTATNRFYQIGVQ